MATAVTIQVKVDSGQAGAAMSKLHDSIKKVGGSGEDSFKKAGKAAGEMGGHFNSSLDAVRLVSQEFGLKLPRAMESMIARMPGVVSGLNSMIGAFGAIAAAQVFVHLAEEGYKLYEQYISLNAQADKFYETLKKTSREDFSQTRNIETTQRRANASTQNSSAAQGAGKALQSYGLSQLMQGDFIGAFVGLRSGNSAAGMGVEAAGDMVKLGKVQLDQTHEQALAQINLNHAMDGALTGEQKINAEVRKKIQVDAETRDFNRKTEMFYGNPSPGDAGATEQRMKDQQATQEGQAQSIVLGRATALAMMKAHDEMVQSNLQGDELYVRKFSDIQRETTLAMSNEGKSAKEIHAAVLAAQSKLDEQYVDKWLEKWRTTQETAATARAAGLSGAARIVADHDNQITRINTNRGLDPDQAASERVAAATEMNQKLKELQDQFRETTLANIAERADAEVSGFARIDAEGTKAYADLQRAYDKAFKDDQGADLGSSADRSGLAAAKAQIAQRTTQQKNQLAQQNNAEDLEYAQQAAQAEARVKEDGLNGWIAKYKNASAEILAEDVRRTAKMEEEAKKQGLTDQEISQRKADIDRTMNAQIAEQNQQMQHQIAGSLQEAFTSPVEFIKSAMEKMFFEIVAGWIMRMHAFQSLFGNQMGGMQAGGGGGVAGTLGGILRGTSGITGNSGIAPSQTAGAALAVPAGGGAPSLGAAAVGSTLGSVSGLAQSFGLGGGTNVSSGPDLNSAMPGATPGLTSAQQSTTSGGSWLDSNGAGALAAAGGAYNAFSGTVDAFKSGNPLTGAMADGAEGAAIGSIVPGVGTVIGAAAGAAIGAGSGFAGLLSGMGGKMSARDYYNKQVFPQLNGLMSHPTGDFQSEIAQANSTANTALVYMGQTFGMDSANWVNDNYMKKELQKVVTLLADTAKGGRQYTQMNAMQFHTGGTITGFGDYATSHNEGMIHAKLGETVMSPGATAEHGSMFAAMNAGASAGDIAARYLAGSSTPSGGPSSSSGDTHFHIHTLDTRTMQGWLKSGGAQMITEHQNNYRAQYAGDGING